MNELVIFVHAPVGDHGDFHDESETVARYTIVWQCELDATLSLQSFDQGDQMVFLYLAFRSYIVFQRRLVSLVKSLEASQDTIVLFVLPLLVS